VLFLIGFCFVCVCMADLAPLFGFKCVCLSVSVLRGARARERPLYLGGRGYVERMIEEFVCVRTELDPPLI